MEFFGKIGRLASIGTVAVFAIVNVSMAAADKSEAKSVWVEAVGTAYGDESDPPREVMQRARREAEKIAVEKAVGTFVRASTLVVNSQLDHKSIISKVKGRLNKVEIVKEERGQFNPNLYRVTIKAQVSQVIYKEEEGIQVSLDLSNNELIDGENLKIHYRTNTNAYVYIYSIAADNSVTILFPNSIYSENFVEAGKENTFPPSGCQIPCVVSCIPTQRDAVAIEKVMVVATRNKEAILETFQEGVARVHTLRTTGTYGDLYRKLAQLEDENWGEALVTYSIKKSVSLKQLQQK